MPRYHPIIGSYVVVCLDPIASLAWLDDPIALEESRKIKCGRYIACVTDVQIDPDADAVDGYRSCTLDLIVQGQPPDDVARFFHHDMAIPIIPNTFSAVGRRPLHTWPGFPWDDCYHAAHLRLDHAQCKFDDPKNEPHSSLGLEETFVLQAYVNKDRAHMKRQAQARDAGHAFAVALYADDELPLTGPWWQQESPDLARITDSKSRMDPNSSSARRLSSSVLDSGSSDCDAASSLEPRTALLAFPFRNEKERVLVRYSYDLDGIECPSDPSGLFEELQQMQRIKKETIERCARKVTTVQKMDDEFIASLEAQGLQISPRKPSRVKRLLHRIRVIASECALYPRKSSSDICISDLTSISHTQ
ncbi:hypothetical protein HDZ31DRAFT_84982 [Schizophyllum fasciatum]